MIQACAFSDCMKLYHVILRDRVATLRTEGRNRFPWLRGPSALVTPDDSTICSALTTIYVIWLTICAVLILGAVHPVLLPVCAVLILGTVHPVLLPVCTILILDTVHPVLLPVCTILVLNTVHAIGLAVCTALVLNTIHAIGLAVCTALVLNTIHAIGLAEALSARHTAVSACFKLKLIFLPVLANLAKALYCGICAVCLA